MRRTEMEGGGGVCAEFGEIGRCSSSSRFRGFSSIAHSRYLSDEKYTTLPAEFLFLAVFTRSLPARWLWNVLYQESQANTPNLSMEQQAHSKMFEREEAALMGITCFVLERTGLFAQ
ncbi:hypothetical protein INR49_012485, partial [Caranx melampygus]